MRVLVSPFNNPFINLALEDFFLRQSATLAFFYVNRPCVVMGRFQNPWLECSLPYLTEKDIWLVRRQSGGGTVYHDEGNLNFCFLTPEPSVNRRRHAELIQQAFFKADIKLEISPRHDLWLDGKKISGSAFKQTKFGSFHHGTFLVSSDLGALEESLKHTFIPKTSQSIASVRSQVTTLNEKFPGVTISDVIELISHEFKAPQETLDATLLSLPEVQSAFHHLKSDNWLWNETPRFELRDMVLTKGSFTKELMKGKISAEELEKYFPDFSEQHRSSNLIL